MTVYVDPMRPCLAGPKWPWGESCHLMADSLVELVEFAVGIGLKKTWLQNRRGGLPHFDLTRSKRLLAVFSGAVEVTLRQTAQRIREARRADALEREDP